MNKRSVVTFLFLLFLLFTGCKTKSITEPVDPANDNSVNTYQSIEKNDLFSGEWKNEKITNTEKFLSFTDYIPQIFPSNEQSERFNMGYFADSKCIYSLDTYYTQGEDGLYYDTSYLNILDGITREVRTITYKAEQGGLGFVMLEPYSAGGRVFATAFSTDDDGIMDEYFIVELKEDGTPDRMTNLCGIVAQKHMLQEPFFYPEVRLYYEPANDRFYLISSRGDCLYLIDRDGNPISELDENGAKEIRVLASTEEGRLIFAREDGNLSSGFFYDGKNKRMLLSNDTGYIGGTGLASIEENGRILYTQNNTVIEWDTVNGTRERLFVWASDGVSDYRNYLDCAMRNSKGEVLVIRNNNLRILTEMGPAKQVTVQIKPFIYFDNNFKQAIRNYEETHPGIRFDLLGTSEWNNRDRDIIELMQNISTGGGADILLLNRDQMLSLDKNDCLIDLSGVFVTPTKDKLISSIWDCGRTDHGIMLLSYGPSINTAIANKKYVNDSSWTVRDIVRVINQREKEGNPFDEIAGGIHPFSVFAPVVCDSEFVNLEAGTCNFNSDLFKEVLEICRRYNKPINYHEDSYWYSELKRDNILMLIPGRMNLLSYSKCFASLGDDYLTVGYPSDSQSASRMDFAMGFAVNRNTENFDVIADFMNWMFSTENESLVYEAPIRKDLFDGRVIVPKGNSNEPDNPYVRLEDGIWELVAKPNGDSYLNEYLAFINQCRYDTDIAISNDIQSILWEEANPFFDGSGKSASEVARIIQSRVSLYLQEKR